MAGLGLGVALAHALAPPPACHARLPPLAQAPLPTTSVQELVTEATNISEDAVQLMKFHGSYQQDNREQRTFGAGKSYQFMRRTRQPAGAVTNQLYLVMDELADLVGGGWPGAAVAGWCWALAAAAGGRWRFGCCCCDGPRWVLAGC